MLTSRLAQTEARLLEAEVSIGRSLKSEANTISNEMSSS